MKKEIIVLEDVWWDEIIWNLWLKNPDFEMPIITNTFDPFEYLEMIIKKAENSIILLDNYFPSKSYPEPLWDKLLLRLLKTWKEFKIICISDYWKKLLDEYKWRNIANKKWWILDWCTEKNADEIYNSLKKLWLLNEL